MRLPRLLLVPEWALFLALAGYAAILIAGYFAPFEPSDLRAMGMLLGFMAAAYGLVRVLLYDPLSRPKYRDWLSTTPWSSRQPLPLGPLHLVWQDALVLGAFELIAKFHFAIPPLLYVGIFGVIYLAFLAMCLFSGGQPVFGWAIFAGIISALGLLPNLYAFSGALVATYLLGYLGLRRSLAAFPWEGRMGLWAQQPQRQPIWFPTPEVRKSGVTVINAFLASALVGALSYVLLRDFIVLLQLKFGSSAHAGTPLALSSNLDAQISLVLLKQFREAMPGMILFVAASLSLGRILVYCAQCWPPLKLLGRLATGRLIVPKYDKVFVAPLLTVLAGVFLPRGLLALGLEVPLVLGLSMACVLFLGLGLGPTLYDWQLTGAHRLVWFQVQPRIAPSR